jgi:SAM-dependent methyltransferase
LSTISPAQSADEPAPCPVCGGCTIVAHRDLFDDRYGYPGLFILLKCLNCGHRHVPTDFTAEELGRLYTSYYPRKNFDIEGFEAPPEVSRLRAWILGERRSAFRWVPRGVKVLDIGCGTGETLAYYRNRGCEAVGIDADDNVLAIAARHNLKIVSGVFDGSQFESSYFDYVTLDQVAEHVQDPHALMRGVHRVLKPGGRAIITSPNPDSFGARFYDWGWLNWHVPYHMQFYTRRSMAILAQRAGLVLTKVRTITAPDWQYYQWRHVAHFPPQGRKSSFWCPHEVEHKRHWSDKVANRVRPYHVHRFISRALDVLGIGDNHVFLLRKPL